MLYIAEAYQCYHAHAIALALARLPDVEVTVYYNDDTTPYHIARIEAAYDAAPLPQRRLKRGFWGWLVQLPKILGMAKKQVMNANMAELLAYDAIVSTENTVAYIHEATRGKHPPLVYITHGSGDRSVAWHPRIRHFDLVMPSGAKTLARLRELGLARETGSAMIGYTKLETSGRIADHSADLFDAKKPIVLYNPHKEPKQSSWNKAIEPLLAQFAGQSEFNLIVAPHVKKFRRRSRRLRNRWEARSTPSILIDTGSDRSVDNSYSEVADIYVGDVSSQVYEFTARPRPCVFLNMHGLDWRGDPEFLFWEMGEVVDHVDDILPAIRRARELHPLYRERQEELTLAALGGVVPQGSTRAAELIVEFTENGALPLDQARIAKTILDVLPVSA